MTLFEWNDAKARANLRKHGISFETATLAFDDPNLVMIKDRVVDGESSGGKSSAVPGAKPSY